MNRALLRITVVLLATAAACTSHHPQAIVAVPEARFRMEAKNDTGTDPNPLRDRALNPDPYFPLNPGPGKPLNPDPAKPLNPDSTKAANPTYSLLPLPLSKENSGHVRDFLEAGGDAYNSQRTLATKGENALLAQLADASKPLTDRDLEKGGALRQWFDRMQTGGVVDARWESPPTYAPIAAHEGSYWWVFYTHGHNLAGLMVFKEAVPASQSRSAQ
jgi:hypothetical protein